MKTFKIRKRRNSYRTIYAPNHIEKRRLRGMLPALQDIAERVDVHNVVHGFRRNRSCVTGALRHVGYRYTLSFDFADWFDSVTLPQIATGFAGEDELFFRVALYAIVDGAPRQGLPTSPVLANIAAAPLDKRIIELASSALMFRVPYTYTRYADDLSISTDSLALCEVLRAELPLLVFNFGWRVNPAKTRLQSSAAGRRMITGIGVDNKTVYPSRSVRRKLRAAEHRHNGGRGTNAVRERYSRSAAGLREHCALRCPKGIEFRRIKGQFGIAEQVESGSSASELKSTITHGKRRIRIEGGE